MNIAKAKPVDDLELYEIIVAAYPEEFNAESEDDIWDQVMEFAEEKFDIEAISDFLGRLVYMTMPMASPFTGKHYHCLGKVSITDGNANMESAISREAVTE